MTQLHVESMNPADDGARGQVSQALPQFKVTGSQSRGQ